MNTKRNIRFNKVGGGGPPPPPQISIIPPLIMEALAKL